MPNSMNIVPPTPEVTQGPEWAEDINTVLTTTIAEHNHQSPNGGVALTQDALAIDGDLSLNGNQLTNANAVGLETLNAPASGSNRLYNDSGDLYYTDGNGTNVRITENGSLSAASFGGISGLSGTSGTATFAGLSTFEWKKDVGEYASMENADITVFSKNDTNPLGGVVIESPDSLAANSTLRLSPQNITLPQTLPTAAQTTALGVAAPSTTTSSLFIDPSGVMTWDYVPPLNFVSSSAILTGSYSGGATAITNSSLAFTGSGRPLAVEVLGGQAGATGYWAATNSGAMHFTLTTRIVHQNGTTYDVGQKTFRVVDENTAVGSFYPYTAIAAVPSGTMTISLRISTAGGGGGSAIEIGESGAETYFSARQL